MLVRAAAIAGLLMIAIGQQAAAHDAAEWIEKNIGAPEGKSYLAPSGTHCCGKHDCEVVPAGTVLEINGRLYVPKTNQWFDYKQQGVYISIDGDWWMCRDILTGNARCLFRPQGGV